MDVQKLERLVDSYKDDIIKSTQEIIKIKSVEDEAKPGKPFGEGVNEALECALNMGTKLGFVSKNYDGYAGQIDLGEGENVVGVLAHLDVVPEGSGWTYPPYAAEIHDDKIYGRGTIDDKGPAIAVLYAMKAIKESGFPIKSKIRLILGTNEESGWGGIKYYLQKEKAPNLAFTPDADFPVIHGEKGIGNIAFNMKIDKKSDEGIIIKSINGGNRPNMVPDFCDAVIIVEDNKKDYVVDKFNKYVAKTGYNITLEGKDGEFVVKSKGISAHGSTPQAGKNAISQLMGFLQEINTYDEGIWEFIDFYNKKIGFEVNGQSIGCEFSDDVSGKLTFNVGMIEGDQDNIKIIVNIRYPIKTKWEDVCEGISKELNGTNIKLERLSNQNPIYLPKDHPLVEKLMKVYREVTGDVESEPITIGGGTYARAMDNAVAFGALFPGEEELAHQKDEYISIDNLIKMTKIYARALYELAK